MSVGGVYYGDYDATCFNYLHIQTTNEDSICDQGLSNGTDIGTNTLTANCDFTESQTSVCIDDYSQNLHITANAAMTLGATDIYDDIVQTDLNIKSGL